MITLIHGEDIAESRNYYFSLRKQTTQPSLDGITISLTDLQQQIEGQDLFGSAPAVFIENLLSKKKNAKDMEKYADILTKAKADVTLWESKELTPAQIKLFPKAVVKVFKIPATIFALLDSLLPGDGTKAIELYQKTLTDKDPEFVLVMLQRQIRILLALQSQEGENISEVARLAPWQRGKLQKQAKSFAEGELIALHSKLFELELCMKTGTLSLPLDKSIDLLLLSL